MSNPQNLKQFKKGNTSGKGRPKGAFNKKARLKKLIKDLVLLNKKASTKEKIIIYQLYKIAFTDYVVPTNSTSEINHLYFIESEIGIKIGKSKDVLQRLKQIQNYSPSAKLIKMVEFAGGYEALLHKKFKSINIHGNKQIGVEWFYKTPELIEFISEIETIEDLEFMFIGKKDKQLELFDER